MLCCPRASCVFFPCLSRHSDLLTVLFILVIAGGTLIESSTSQSHHYQTHTVTTKYGALRGVKIQFSSAATRHLGNILCIRLYGSLLQLYAWKGLTSIGSLKYHFGVNGHGY